VSNPTVLSGTGGLGLVPESFANDVSNSGVVVGTTDGLGVAYTWDPIGGIVALTEPVGAGADGISTSGAIAGSVGTGPGSFNAALWQGGNQELLETPESFNSVAADISPNGEYIGGAVTFEDLTLFESINQAAVWVNGELNRLEDSDGNIFQGVVRGVSDNGYAVGQSSDGLGFIWHESFVGVRMFDEWLLTEHGETLPTTVTGVADVLFAGEKLHFAVNGSAYFVSATVGSTPDPMEPTHVGTEGADNLRIDVTGLSRVVIETGGGNDRVVVHGTPADGAVITINTGDGNDKVILETTAAVTVNLGAGHDRFFGNLSSTSPVTVFGGAGNDRIHGGGGDDLLLGEDGNDWLYGRDGDDTLDGGNGRNRLFGHQGNDYLIGGNQRDIARGGDGDDIIDLGAGNDVAHGGDGNDILLGGDGNDRLRGGNGNDSLFGGSGSDRLFSFQGNNYLSGGDDNDRICSFGTDRIDAGAGADLIRIGQPSTQVVADDNDTLRGSFGVSATRINRDENNAFIDAAFARLLALDAEYELPLL